MHTTLSIAQDNVDNGGSQFQRQIQHLIAGKITKMSLEFLDSIKINTVLQEKIDDRDLDRNRNGLISAGQLNDISVSSICEITDNYTLIVVEDKYQQLRALTVSANGIPIESILISDNLLFLAKDWYEYEARRYSPSRPYYYDSLKHEFRFSTIFKIMEPRSDGVLIDLKDHEDETTNQHVVKVNNDGKFEYSSYKQINHNSIKFPFFTLKSSFFDSEWAKSNESYYSNDSTCRIILDSDQSLQLLNNNLYDQDEIIRIIPYTRGKMEVHQRHVNVLAINGDGDYCTMDSLRYVSDWTELELKNDLFSVQKYLDEDSEKTINISVQDLKRITERECGEYHLSLIDDLTDREDIASISEIREVILKIRFTDQEKNTSAIQYLIFEISAGC